MNNVVIWDAPLFKRSVVAVMGCSELDGLKAIAEFCDKHASGCKTPDLEMVHTASGWCQDRNGDVYIWVQDNSPSVLLHEIVHAAFRLCAITDIAIDEELIARLVEAMKINVMDALLYPAGEDE